MAEITGTAFLTQKIIEMDAQIVQLGEDLATTLAVVEALGRAGKYELVRTEEDGGTTLHWKSQKGKIITL